MSWEAESAGEGMGGLVCCASPCPAGTESDRFRRAGLVVFSDDWGRHPSSCQHLVGRLLGRHEALWVNTIGTRPPRLDRATLTRAVEKLRGWVRARPARLAPGDGPGPRVCEPKMWAWFRTRLDRRLNVELLARQLAPKVAALPEPRVVVTTVPLVADLLGRLPVDRWVYYGVDDLSVWPGTDGDTLRRMERLLLGRVDEVIAVSESLRDSFREAGWEPALLTHGVDLDHWRSMSDSVPAPELDGLERPLITFWGLVDRRLDLGVLDRLAADLRTGTILLVGPESDPDPALGQITRVVRVPALAYGRLPDLARTSDVLIMPYADLPVTRAMQPLKLKEYLASGRPAVAAALPANREWADCLDLASTPEAFSAAVRLRLATGLPHDQASARGRLEGEGWESKAREFERLILRGLEGER